MLLVARLLSIQHSVTALQRASQNTTGLALCMGHTMKCQQTLPEMSTVGFLLVICNGCSAFTVHTKSPVLEK